MSDGYKVLWLAHTHHLLEQALDSFGKRGDGADEMEVGLIREPKERLRARVVSGTPGHSRIAAVSPDDDVVICTLQTVVRAYREKHAALRAFLDASKGRLMVVFDEAHHAPAPSYTEFILDLRREAPKMKLLGLTATPMYNDEKRGGWLAKLFPQKKLFEVSASRLIAEGILAQPVAIPCSTKLEPKLDAAQFQRWRASYQDVPEDIITQLAMNQQRNDMIWKTYVDRRVDFGKTIIFADRWFQCDYLREKLLANGVRADVVYSHVDADPGSAEARNRRTRDDNATVLKAFHGNQLDVLINVRMLTEGTDVPSVQSVFITRQTTSRILLRQMVGRALRGTKFGGTAKANIVLFTDDWREAIEWAEFDELGGTETGTGPKPQKALPLQLVSIELIRRLARQMESGEIATASFLELLPLGWYVPEFDVEVSGSEDTEHVHPMVLVYGDEKERYDAFLDEVAKADLRHFADPGLEYDAVRAQMEGWRHAFFADESKRANGIGLKLFPPGSAPRADWRAITTIFPVRAPRRARSHAPSDSRRRRRLGSYAYTAASGGNLPRRASLLACNVPDFRPLPHAVPASGRRQDPAWDRRGCGSSAGDRADPADSGTGAVRRCETGGQPPGRGALPLLRQYEAASG